jgi:ParB family chromosome partitioning protein
MSEVRDIPIGLVDVGDYNQRFGIDPEELDGLCGSVRRVGILEPLLVRCSGDRFVLVVGHRRYAAAVRVGLATVPCIVRDGTEAQSREEAFAENLFRSDPSPVELAVAIAKATEDGEHSIEQIADGMRRSPEWVRRQLAMLRWPEDVLQCVHRGSISVAAAANLAMVAEDTYRSYLLENAAANGATARTTAAWLQAWEAALPSQQAVQQPPVDSETRATPMMPQAPCLCCGQVKRTDELSHVPLCGPCINRVRRLDA